jgi:hypothetical protein
MVISLFFKKITVLIKFYIFLILKALHVHWGDRLERCAVSERILLSDFRW